MSAPNSSSPKISFDPITKLIDAIWGFISGRVCAKIKHDDRGVTALRKLHLISEKPEPDFDSVYAYSLAEYGKGRPEAAKRLFRHKFIKSAFSKAFDQMNTSIVQIEAQNLPESSTISKEFQQMDCDPRNEIPVFVEIFYYMVQQTRTPAEVVRDQMLTDIKEVQEELGNKLIEAVNQLRGELDLSLNWFSYRFRKQLAGVGDKYIPELHTPTNIDEIVNAVLVDDSFVKALQGRFSRLAENYKMYSQVAHELNNPFPKQIDWSESKHQVLEASNQLKESLNTALSTVKEAIEEILQYRFNKVRQVDWDTLKKDIDESGKNYGNIISKIDVKSAAYTGDESIHKHLIRELSNKLEEPKWQAEDFYDNLLEFIEQIDYLNSSYLHLIGSAGIGKTHLVTHICQSRLKKGQPSIFILGRHFTTGQPIHEQLKSILDIPTRYSWQEFLSSLSIVSRARKTRIPIFIDGLNEATLRGEFSKIWKDDLREFISELETYEELVLITTCRASYKDEIWPSNDDTNIIDMYGFDSLSVETAIEKYFDYYKIRADLTDVSTAQFEHPIYLRIFCEGKNAERMKEVEVYID